MDHASTAALLLAANTDLHRVLDGLRDVGLPPAVKTRIRGEIGGAMALVGEARERLEAAAEQAPNEAMCPECQVDPHLLGCICNATGDAGALDDLRASR